MSDLLKKKRTEFIEEALKELPFADWSEELCVKVDEKLGSPKNQYAMLFARGVADVVDFYEQYADQKMIDLFEAKDLKEIPRIQDKIKYAVRCRLDNGIPNSKLVIAKTSKYYKSFNNFGAGLKAAWRSVDLMWKFAGDKSTDYNYYTKRSLLFTVYSSTASFYMADDSKDNVDTWSFLDKRIQNVMKIGSLKKNLTISNIFAKLPFIRLFKNKR